MPWRYKVQSCVGGLVVVWRIASCMRLSTLGACVLLGGFEHWGHMRMDIYMGFW